MRPRRNRRRPQAKRQSTAGGFGRLLAAAGLARAAHQYQKNQIVFLQGDRAGTLFYIQGGKVKLSVVCKKGKEATLALLGPGDFLGEACIVPDQRLRTVTATAITDCSLLRIERNEMLRALHEERAIAKHFVSYLLARNRRIQEDLVDQLFNSSEKRLARALLLLARFGREKKSRAVIPKISQQELAEMIGTTRPRVNLFLNRFRKMGLIEYNGELKVRSSLLSVVLRG